MDDIVDLVGPNRALAIFGVKLVGANAENAKKLLFTLIFIVLVVLLTKGLRALTRRALYMRGKERVEFWSRQGLNLFGALLLFLGVTSIWFDDPTRLTTALGLVTAGLAFALQKVITAMAGYIVILRGKTFNVGDRIVMGGVRGDVIALDFTQTTIMEMGQPPPVQRDEPAMWVRSRQYTGRVVTVSNARIFDEPVFNYTREFPFLWEEVQVPIPFGADLAKAERILLEAAAAHGVRIEELGQSALEEMRRRYFMQRADVRPRVYVRLTDNWIELTVRFIAREHGVREIKDQMSREVLGRFQSEGLAIASSTLQVQVVHSGVHNDNDIAAPPAHPAGPQSGDTL
jgi:small-conductance mechanosensitive channel